MDVSLGQLSQAQLSLLRERLQGLKVDVVVAVVFGSAARGELRPESDIDLLVIAPGLSTLEAQAHYKPTGREIGRPINLVVFSPEGWRDACENGNPFPRNILARPLIPLVGQLSTLENKFSEGHEVYLQPQNPGPLGTLEQWGAWRDELLALGKYRPGVDVELAVAELAIRDLRHVEEEAGRDGRRRSAFVRKCVR